MELLVLIICVACIGVILTSLVIGTTFIMTLIYASYSYCDGSENNRSRYSPGFQKLFTKILSPFTQCYIQYDVVYQSKSNTSKDNKLLKKRVKHYLKNEDGDVAIFAASPHGFIALATFLLACVPQKEYWKEVRLHVHYLLFKVPLVREIVLALGANNVTRENIHNQLKNERHSVCIVTDGCRGMISDKENPIQRHHKGFLKESFNEKIPIFPIIHIGQDEIFKNYSCPLLDQIRLITLSWTSYPFPTIFFGPFPGKLRSIVLDMINPSDFQSEEEFINFYYDNVTKHYQSATEFELL
jgi:hypothetical protein